MYITIVARVALVLDPASQIAIGTGTGVANKLGGTRAKPFIATVRANQTVGILGSVGLVATEGMDRCKRSFLLHLRCRCIMTMRVEVRIVVVVVVVDVDMHGLAHHWISSAT